MDMDEAMIWKKKNLKSIQVNQKEESEEDPGSGSVSLWSDSAHCGLSDSVNDAILRITETPLSALSDITQPSTAAAQHPSHTHTHCQPPPAAG